MFKGKKSKGLMILAALIAAIAIFLIWKYEAWELFSMSYLRRFTGRIRDLKAMGVILYLFVYAVSVLLFMPSLPFTLLGGITYGIGWRIVAITRMVPIIPHWFQNYAYGVTQISFKTYAFVCFLSILPGTAVWVFTINTLGRGQEDAKRSMLYLALATIAIVGGSYIPKYIYKKKHLNNRSNP